jgi:hypothetical protein
MESSSWRSKRLCEFSITNCFKRINIQRGFSNFTESWMIQMTGFSLIWESFNSTNTILFFLLTKHLLYSFVSDYLLNIISSIPTSKDLVILCDVLLLLNVVHLFLNIKFTILKSLSGEFITIFTNQTKTFKKQTHNSYPTFVFVFVGMKTPIWSLFHHFHFIDYWCLSSLQIYLFWMTRFNEPPPPLEQLISLIKLSGNSKLIICVVQNNAFNFYSIGHIDRSLQNISEDWHYLFQYMSRIFVVIFWALK